LIKYIGSKRLLVPHILETVAGLNGVQTVGDLFSGTSRVGHALKRAGYRVTANDHTAYAHTLARCYVQANAQLVRRDAERLLRELSAVTPRAGWFTDVFCEQSRFFQAKNGAKIEAIRERIRELALEPDLEAVLLVSLMEAADRVDSTCGVQMAYLKWWAPRSHNDLELRLPEVLDGAGRATCLDAFAAAGSEEYDLVYLDPPYNQHKYMNNYHVWETLVRWDAPEVYGRACKRLACREYDSPFNSKARIRAAFESLVQQVRARYILVSFSSEGYLRYDDLVAILSGAGELRIASHDYKRYVGAQIGIYNPSGEKVGKVSHLHNQEHLFLVDRGPRC
jgi:adenine-specific DNA-methyltransferase